MVIYGTVNYRSSRSLAHTENNEYNFDANPFLFDLAYSKWGAGDVFSVVYSMQHRRLLVMIVVLRYKK